MAAAAQARSTQGTLVTVTTVSDASGGDVSSVAALLANPGPDGISLREAIEATNNDPGSYSVRFDASLSGATILVGATWRGGLPPLTGGGVSIDGDVDGDGHPDVTLADRSGGTASFGFDVVSSGNRLHALALQGFPNGVLFTASPSDRAVLPTGQTFAGNVVSGLVITGSATSGIRIWPAGPDPGHEECVRSACRTSNRWTDTQLVGNTIESGGDGIGAVEVALEGVAGDVVERLTVEGNVIRLTRPGHGMNLTAGGGAHADSNRIADVLVAHNTIEAPAQGLGINTWSGVRGGSANLVEDLRIFENTIRFSGPASGVVAKGIAFAISDGCNPPGCAAPDAVFPEKNVVRRVEVVGNVIEGSATGIVVDPCCAGTTGSLLTDVRIAGNTITSTIPRHDRNPWGIVIGTGGALAVSNVVVEGNTVVQRAPGRRSGYAAYLAGGGIAVLGGLVAVNGSIRNVVISGNRVDTPLAGITIVGGGPSGEFPNYDATGNRVFGVQLRANRIVRAPVLATRWNRRVKGISVIGGLGGPRPRIGYWPRSTGNSVKCVTLSGNVVVGKRDVVSVFANLGQHASSNTARLGGC